MDKYSDINTHLIALCSEIGRGHPSYLDSVLLALSRLTQTQLECRKLPNMSTGFTRLAWRFVRTVYQLSGLGGPATWLYNRLRHPDARPSKWQLSLLGSALRHSFAGYPGTVLVDHPLLAHILADTCRVAYIHGEIATPGFCAVPSVWRTFVPLDTTAKTLISRGLKPESISVTGLLIEPQLVQQADKTYTDRLQRLSCTSTVPLTIGFFTSGAHPRPHLSRIMHAVASVTRTGYRAIVFWGLGWLRAARAQLFLRRFTLPDKSVQPVWAHTRQDETARTAEIFPQLDILVAAAHERTNWALGLGLPMFALFPHIGPFARENFAFAQNQGVCLPLQSTKDATVLGSTLHTLRKNGRLVEMSRAGWGKYSITGAETAARSLLANVSGDSLGRY